MEYKVNKQERYTIFSLEEENLNSVIAPNLKSEFVILSNEGVKNLILNLEAVKFVDSSGLSAILTANRLWSRQGTFVLTGVKHPSVKTLITISRLDSILNILPTIQESIDDILMDEIKRELNPDKS